MVSVLQCEYEIQVQLLEIYNEQLRDLLDNTKSHARLDIRNTERSGLNVPDAIQVCLCSALAATCLGLQFLKVSRGGCQKSQT